MRMPTPSRLWLAQACVYPWTSGETWADDAPGPESRLGSAFHELASMVLRFHVPPRVEYPWSLGDVATRYELDDLQRQTLERMIGGFVDHPPVDVNLDWSTEVAYAYDAEFDLARQLPPADARDYSSTEPGEIPGTADVVGIVGPRGILIDWKTGQGAHVAPAAENAQLRCLALAVARTHHLDSVDVALGWVDHDGMVRMESALFDANELDAIAAELAGLAKRLSEPPKPEPGPHCRYCPVLSSCPATREALVQVAPIAPPEPYSVVTHQEAITGPQHATWLLHRVRAVKAACEAVESVLRLYADQVGGIETGDGHVWQRRDIPTERVDLSPEGVAMLRNALPTALKETSSKSAIAAAAKEAGIDPTEMLTRLRDMGCLRDVMSHRYEDVSQAPRRNRSKKVA